MIRRSIYVVLFVCVLTSISLADDSNIPGIDVFMQIGSASSGQISPADNSIYFTMNLSGEPQIYRINENGWPYRLTFFPDGIGGFTFSPDGSKIIVTAAPGGNERRQIFIMDPITGSISALTDNPDARFGSICWAPDSKNFFYYSTEANGRDFYIYSMNSETGESKLVIELPGINDGQDVSRDGKTLLIETWPKNVKNDLYLLNLESGESKQILKQDDDYMFTGTEFTPDGKHIWVVTNFNDTNFKKVARYDIAADKLEFVNLDSRWETEDFDLSDDGNFAAWVSNEDGYGSLHIIDARTMEILPVPELAGIVSSIRFGYDNKIIFTFFSPTRTADLWTWDWTKSELTQITFSSYAGIDPALFVEPELIHYETFDGLKIPAFLYLPEDYVDGVIPFIIHAHGGPEGQSRPYFQRHFQFLLLHGFGILMPNVRGSEGYGREFMALDNHRKRLDSIKDYKAAADYLIDNGYAKKGKIGIKGGSYGGYVALAAITEYPDYWGASSASVGISNFKTFLLNTADYRRYIREAEYGPLSDSVWLETISPLSKADRVTAPLQLIHGTNDPRVPIGEARQMAEIIIANGGVADTLFFTNEGHGTANIENTITKYTKLVEFFEKYLKD